MLRREEEQGSAGEHQPEHEEERELAAPIYENIQHIAELRRRHESRASQHQRRIERVTDFLARPLFLFIVLAIVVGWLVINILLFEAHIATFDAPPFPILQVILSMGAVLMSTVVLISQHRQNELAEKRADLDVQASLLADRKMSKLIEMIDDLCMANNWRGREQDTEVDALKEPMNPHEVLVTLKRSLQEAKEAALEE